MNLHYYSTMAFLIFISFLLCGVSCSNKLPEDEDEQRYIFINRKKSCIIGQESGCNSNMFRDIFLHHQNSERKTIGAKLNMNLAASNMLQMEWDQTLADGAWKYVETCFLDYPTYVGIEVCREASIVTTFDGGVNYYRKTYKEDYPHVVDRILNAIANWTNYIYDYDKSKLKVLHLYQESGAAEDSWSQVVRATTWKFGCALADGRTGNRLDEFVEVIACFYGNTKLHKGEEIFKPGKPCSACPLGTHCNDNLCEVEPGQCPVPGNDFALEGQHCPKIDTVEIQEDSEESGEILWECDLHKYGEQCEILPSCSPFWNIDLVGNFKTITVKGDCVSANVFLEEISVVVPSCFRFQYIKERNPTRRFHTMVMGFAFNLNSGESINVMKNEDANSWADVNLDIPWTDAVIQVGILVRSYSDNIFQQYVTVGNFSVFEGNCS